MRLAAALLAALAGVPAFSATIEVKVVGPDGEGVPGVSVFADRRVNRTDDRGVALLEVAGAGTWVLRVDPPSGTALLPRDGRENRVSIPAGTANVSVTIPLRRGDVVRGKVVGNFVPRYSSLNFRSPGAQRALSMDRNGIGTLVLEPGLWQVLPGLPEGVAWASIEVDGRPWTGPDLRFETPGEGRVYDVTLEFVAPGRLAGRVSIDGPSRQVLVVATLERAGPWQAPGASLPWAQEMKIATGLERDGSYARDLAEGTWLVTVTGPKVVEVDPPSIRVEIGRGTESTASFRVRTADAEGPKGTFVVRVLDPDGRPVPAAPVEVRALVDEAPSGAPVASGIARNGVASVEAAVAKGSYVVAASHERWLWGSTVLRDLEIAEGERIPVEVALRRGGGIAARVDSDARPALDLVRVDDPVPTPFYAQAQAQRSSQRRLPLDVRGEGIADGLEPGRFRITVADPGPRSEAHVFFLRVPDGEPAPSVEIDLREGEVAKVEVVTKPAAAATARFSCADGAPVAESLEVRGFREDDADEPSFRMEAPAREDRRATWGPLAAGRWRFEFQPKSFTRTTWAPGTEIEADARTFTLDADGVPADLGTIEVDCDPAVRLTMPLRDAGGALDTTLARVSARRRAGADAPWQAVDGLRVEPGEGEIVVRGLPEGDGTLELTVEHPHLLDRPATTATIEGKRRRGSLVPVATEIRGLGGAIAVPGAARLRLTRDGESRVVPVDASWRAAVSILPGTYDVAACDAEDVSCSSPTRRWPGVEVVAGGTTGLR